jgi:nicotinate phosphoribosyltransferase
MTSILLNDLYQFSMAEAYYKAGIHEDECTFDLFFRSIPEGWGYLIACGIEEAFACGIEEAINFINRWHEDDLDPYTLVSKKIISEELFKYLCSNIQNLREKLFVRVVQEGTIIFPNEPVLTITGPRILCQLLETPLLNIINYQTLIASKASRIVNAANGKSVIEFGLRRAQGQDAAIKGSRAAYIGGCVATSNVEAGTLYDITIAGTHAHSFVMSFTSEIEAFKKYAETFPESSTFLIDTYDTIQGAKNAAIVGKEMKEKGFYLKGVRIDSGDLLKLSNQVRRILDEAGLPFVKIIASNDLNEFKIDRLIKMGCKIDSFGVGTELITAKPESALSGVYKLVEDINGDKVKLSLDKKTMPGKKDIIRDKEKFIDYVVSSNEMKNKTVNLNSILLTHVKNYKFESLSAIRERVARDIKSLPESLKSLNVPRNEIANRVVFSDELLKREKEATSKIN